MRLLKKVPWLLAIAWICACSASYAMDEQFPEGALSSVVAIMIRDAKGALHPHGTGFLMYNYEPTPHFLVTNRHVFEPVVDGKPIRIQSVVVKANLKPDLLQQVGQGKWLEFEVKLWDGNSPLWTGHPNDSVDVAVIYFPPIETLSVMLENASDVGFIPKSLCGSLKDLRLSEDVLFFGFPLGMGTLTNPIPFVRSGMVAQIDSVRKMFWLDAQVFGGSSGSPVISAGVLRGQLATQKTPKLVGIVSGYMPSVMQAQEVLRPSSGYTRDTVYVENSGLAVVFSVDLVSECASWHNKRLGPKYLKMMQDARIAK